MQRMLAMLSVALAFGAAGCSAAEDAPVDAPRPRAGASCPAVGANLPHAAARSDVACECGCGGAIAASAGTPALGPPGTGGRAAARAVDANSATSAELEAISGIGPALAGRIVEERSRAPFRSIEDLQERVRGVGENTLRKMRENGLAVARPDAGSGVETIVGGARDAPAAGRARRTAKKPVQPGQRKQRGK